MLTRPRVSSAAAFIGCLLAISAYAQDISTAPPDSAPANLAYVEGMVDVVQEGLTERADPPLMLLAGDLVRTQNGRAEIVFDDGTILHLSHDSELELLGPARVRLRLGRALFRTSHAAAGPYVIDTPASSVHLETDGEYSLTVSPDARLEVDVARGTATVGDGGTPATIGGGLRLMLAGPGARPLIESYNSARWDAFERWAHDRIARFSTAQSASQLPYELRSYAPLFDQYGRWDYVAPHGYVWFPSVGIHWRPYYDGWWSFTSYGWTWRGRDPFAWPTHHYGRWGFNGSFWYWIPATRWGPAWVSWSIAPGYVGWAPLGWDGRPAVGLWARRDHPAYRPNYSPWRGWTIVPRRHFAPRRNVRRHAVDGDRLDQVTRRTLERAVPISPSGDVAVPRRDAPGGVGERGRVRRPAAASAPAVVIPSTRSAGDVAVPRRGSSRQVGERSRVRRAAGAAAPGVAAPPATSTGAQRRPDAPAYAPPSSQRTTPAERRGSVRSRERSTTPQAAPRAAPRQAPKASAPAPQPRTRSAPPAAGSSGRAVPRGGSGGAVRSPSRGQTPAARPADGAPRSQGTQGGARRRPPGV